MISLSLNLALAMERGRRTSGAATDDSVGRIIPAVSVAATDGTVTRFTWSGRDTILYYFHPDCRWCERNVEAVAALASLTRGRFDFIAVTSAESARRGQPLRVPTYSRLGEDVRRELRLRGTPETLVVGHGGKILQKFVGAYTGATKVQVERFFQVSLPAIAATSPSVR